MIEMDRVNNASWCCDEIEKLVEYYKKQCAEARAIGHVQYRAKVLVYYEVIRDLETILYGESEYDY